MKRRDFFKLLGLGAVAAVVPQSSEPISDSVSASRGQFLQDHFGVTPWPRIPLTDELVADTVIPPQEGMGALGVGHLPAAVVVCLRSQWEALYSGSERINNVVWWDGKAWENFGGGILSRQEPNGDVIVCGPAVDALWLELAEPK